MTTWFRSVSLAFVGVILISIGGRSQAPTLQVQIGEDILVGQEPRGRTFVEPHLAAHPTDPRHLLAVGWVLPEGEQRDDPSEHCATFLSADGGRTWTRRDLPGRSCQDPWLSLTEQAAVLTAMGTHPALPDSADQLLAYFSKDGGRTWHDVPQGIGRGHDGPRSIADRAGTVYVVSGQYWTDELGKSRHTIPVGVARGDRMYVELMNRVKPSNLNLNADALAVLSDGSLVISYSDYGRKVDGTWKRAGALKTRRSWAVVSRDGGRSVSVPLFISESCYDRPTSLAADTSRGPFRDRLYYACSGDDRRNVMFNYSADGGDEWSAPAPIEAPASQAGARWTPQVATNAEGIVAVAWMDRRDDPSGRCYAPYIVASADGGRTFSTAVRVASAKSCPDSARLGFPASRWPVGGDYFGLVAAADGRFHLLWPDARDGGFHLRTAAVAVRVGRGE